MTTSAMEYPKGRKEALEGGHRRYHGKPCKNCGETLKRVNQGDCVGCHKTRLRNRQREFRGTPEGHSYRKALKTTARAGHKQVLVSWASGEAITAIYDKARKLGMEVDHIIPLKSPLVCSLHVENNLQMLTKEENFSKRNKFDPMTFEA